MWQKIIAFGVWLIIIGVVVLYYYYFNALKSIGELILYILPIILFAAVGTLAFSRNERTAKRAKEKAEFHITAQMNWGQALKHDLLTYFVPVLIISLPLLFKQSPNVTDILQACLAFLAFVYLKLLYWHQL